MDSRNFAIGVLSTTATILLVGLFVIHSRPATVQASGMTVSGGAYTMTVGRDPSGDQDYVYVLTGPSKRIVAYRFDAGRQRIEIVQGIDLATLNPPGTPQGAPGGKQAPRRRRP